VVETTVVEAKVVVVEGDTEVEAGEDGKAEVEAGEVKVEAGEVKVEASLQVGTRVQNAIVEVGRGRGRDQSQEGGVLDDLEVTTVASPGQGVKV
jgi:hypothetical protein